MQVKHEKLGNIVSVRAATIFREQAPKQSSDGNVRGLTIKDMVAYWPVRPEALPLISVDEHLLGNCLTGGEILIPARGEKYPARYFETANGQIFPYGQINIITPANHVLGRYLAWYLNQPVPQQFIQTSLSGTGIKALNRSRLLEIPIQVPPLETQRLIADLQKLREDSKALKERSIKLEEQETEWACRQLLSNMAG